MIFGNKFNLHPTVFPQRVKTHWCHKYMLTETFKILGVAFEPVAETWQSFVATEKGKWITMNSSLMNY